MKNILKKIITLICTKVSLKKVYAHGKDVRVNFPCKFTSKTTIGNNCHFNGMKVTGQGNVTIEDNFHSGKDCLIVTSFHNYDNGESIPYDKTNIDKDVLIGENVWLGIRVMILGGVKIGEGAIIQAGSVVVNDIPSGAIAGGHPAKVFKYRDMGHYNSLKEQKKFF